MSRRWSRSSPQHFLELVVVVAGKKEQAWRSLQPTAAGRIFRFCSRRCRTARCASRSKPRLRSTSISGSSDQRRSAGAWRERRQQELRGDVRRARGGLARRASAVSGSASLSLHGEPEAPVASGCQIATPGEQPGGVPGASGSGSSRELALAKEAFAQASSSSRAGESAPDLYRSALAIDPNSDARRKPAFARSSTRFWNEPSPRSRRSARRGDSQHRNGARHRCVRIRVWRSSTRNRA